MLKLLAVLDSLGKIGKAIASFFRWLEARRLINQGRMEKELEIKEEQDAVENILDDAASSGPSGVSEQELIRPRPNQS